MEYHLQTYDGHRYAVTLQTLPDKIHQIEHHLLLGTFKSAVLIATDESGEAFPLFHILPGWRTCRRMNHQEYVRHQGRLHVRAWRALCSLAAGE